jgi:hypothetical protein
MEIPVEAYKDFSLEDKEGEVWKDICDYEGIYQISNHGRVKSLARFRFNGFKYIPKKECILKQTFDKKGGVCRVCLKKEGQQKGYTVAINVLRYFGNLRDFNIETISYHKDGNITNNHIDNLFYHTTDTVANRYTKYKSKINCSFVKARQKYRVRLLINKVYHNIGYFETELEAMKAYDDFIVKHNLKRKGNFIDNRV